MRSTAWYSTLGALVLSAAALVPGGTVGHPGTGTGTQTATGTAAGTARETETGGLPLPMRDAREAVGAALAAREAAKAGIDWHACPASQELPASAECGEVAVPVDYADPAGEATVLTVSRRRATGPAARRQGPLLHNPGGPGADGMGFPLYPTLRGGVWKRLNSAYDFVGYAPRGVGGSGRLLCRAPEQARDEPSRGARSALVPSGAYKRQLRDEAAEFAESCARRHGSRLDHFTTADNARDLDVLRAALRRDGLSFIGTSWGSYLGSVYATLFPGHVRRLVLDSVVDPRPRRIWYGDALAQHSAFQRRWRAFTSWTARHDSVYGLGRDARSVQDHFDGARTAAARGRFDVSGGDDGARRLLRSYLAAGYREESWPRLARALARFAEGDDRPLSRMAAPDRRTAAEQENSDSVYSAVQCSEGHWPRQWRRWERDHGSVAGSAPYQTWETVRADLPCAYWEAGRARPVDVRTAPGELPPVLLLASTRDAATPYEGAVETWRRLPGSSLVTEKGTGTHGVAGGNRCADAHLAAYLLKGDVPGRAAACPGRHAPRAGGTT